MLPECFPTPIEGLKLIKPSVFSDQRGYFTESYNESDFSSIGIKGKFVQDNRSMSAKGALRGMHFQKPPFAQAKLVQVISGSVLDIVVDIRKESETYGKHYTVVLSDDNFLQLYIPEGFAHGFLTLEDNTVFAYKCMNYYNKQSEDGLLWNDPFLAIPWGIKDPILSDKDKNFIGFDKFISPF
jgi:dTDP-4-dehydrorhamnose 3,5-epimerase